MATKYIILRGNAPEGFIPPMRYPWYDDEVDIPKNLHVGELFFCKKNLFVFMKDHIEEVPFDLNVEHLTKCNGCGDYIDNTYKHTIGVCPRCKTPFPKEDFI